MNPLLHPVCDLLAKSAGIILLAFATQQLWRGASAAQRCAVWLAAFLVLLLLPLTLLWEPYWSIGFAQPVPKAPLQPPVYGPMLVHADGEAPVVAESGQQTWLPSFSAAQWAAFVWLAGCAGCLAWRVLGSVQLRRLKFQSDVVADGRVLACAARVARALGMRRGISLRVSSFVSVPLTWGSFQPVILLPDHAMNWDEERLEAALRHEMGHIRHWDALTRLATCFITAAYWPNALVWMAARAWRTAQEQAADDLVISFGAVAENYALQLLEAARNVQAAGMLRTPAMAMARPSTLEKRLSAIMDRTRNRCSGGMRATLAGGTAALGMLALCAVAQLRAAEDKPAPAATRGGKMAAKARSLIVPSIKLKGASLGQAVAFLQQQAVTLDPEHVGLNLVIDDPDRDKNAEISLDLTTVPITEALRYLAALSNRVVRYEPDAIFISPVSAAGPLMTRAYKLPPGAAAKVGNAREWLTRQGMNFPEGSSAALIAEGPQLVIKNIQAELENVEGYIAELAAAGVAAPDAPVKPVAQPSPLEAKAAAIILPQVQFQDATVAEAVEFLRVKARELDPDKKGVPIIVKNSDVPENVRIALSLRNVPLSEALRYTAELFGLSIVVEPYAVVLKAKGAK